LGIISILIPNAMANDDDFEINQEKVLEHNLLSNTAILAVQKSAECNTNVEQADCEAMGMRTNEQGECEDINMFGPTPIPTPVVVEESPVDHKPVDTGEGGSGGDGGSSEDNTDVGEGGVGGDGGSSEDKTDLDGEGADGEGGNGGGGGDVEDHTNVD
jgi:hypothetical protein